MDEKGKYNNNGRVAVITGSSKGIGKSIAMEFARAGYSIVMNARHEQHLSKLLKKFQIPLRMKRKLSHLPETYLRSIFVCP